MAILVCTQQISLQTQWKTHNVPCQNTPGPHDCNIQAFREARENFSELCALPLRSAQDRLLRTREATSAKPMDASICSACLTQKPPERPSEKWRNAFCEDERPNHPHKPLRSRSRVLYHFRGRRAHRGLRVLRLTWHSSAKPVVFPRGLFSGNIKSRNSNENPQALLRSRSSFVLSVWVRTTTVF